MGFLGFGNYSKPGKGVKKEESQKKRFFQFFDLFARKFGKLIKLNLLFVLFCLPSLIVGVGAFLFTEGTSLLVFAIAIVAIGFTGPATAAMMKIVRYYNDEKPVFLFSDFLLAYKENFKQGLLIALINGTLFFILTQSFLFYYVKLASSFWYCLPLGVIAFVSIVAIMTNFYTFLVAASVNLKFVSLIKNCMSFAFIGGKTNLITLFFTLLIVVPSILFLPYTAILLLLIVFSGVSMIIGFNSFQYIYKYSIRPYYVMNNLPDPYEEKEDVSETIFEDAT